MKAHETTLCAVCGKIEAVMSCDHCEKPLCRDCRKLDLWGSGAEDLSVKCFCPECKDNPDANPWGARVDDAGSNTAHDAAIGVQERRTVKAA
jgi:hypothetical protein